MDNVSSPLDFEERLSRLERAAEVVAKFENADLQAAAYAYLLTDTIPDARSAFSRTDPIVEERDIADNEGAAGDISDGSEADGSGVKRGSRRRSASRKQSLNFDKTLDFYSRSGELGVGLKDFVELHPARTALQKSVIAAYWLKKELAVEELAVDHVYSAFKTLGWIVPANLLNTLQKAGSENFLDTRKSADIKLTTHGENLVEFELVVKPTE